MSQFIEMVGDPRNNPKGWPTKRLSELAEYSIGLTYKPEQICDNGTIQYLKRIFSHLVWYHCA